MTSTTRFDEKVLSDIASGAAAAYPHEGCGALLGPPPQGGPGHVTFTLSLPNAETGRPRDRFEIAPRDYLAIEDEADRRGLALLGFWHSHPDGEARPSATDRAYAWEGLLTVIVAVEARRPHAVGAWEILAPDAPFTPVVIEAGARGGTAPAAVTTLAGLTGD